VITGTADLYWFALLVDEESVTSKIVSDYFSLPIDVGESNNVFSYLAQKIKP
jgi:hypothetical protein